jgi:hypothetical protein
MFLRTIEGNWQKLNTVPDSVKAPLNYVDCTSILASLPYLLH